MACGGKCWRTMYLVDFGITNQKFIGNCVEPGPGVALEETSEFVAFDALKEHINSEFPDIHSCEEGCRCQEVTDAEVKETARTDQKNAKIVVVHDSDAGRCIIELDYSYDVQTVRIEGTCVKTEVSQPRPTYERRTPKMITVKEDREEKFRVGGALKYFQKRSKKK